MTSPTTSRGSDGRAGSRLTAILLGLCAAFLVLQSPTSAHPLDVDLPPNYDSRVTGMTGDHQGIQARVERAYELLVLEVPEGVEVEVPGYNAPEEYLRFDASGDVHANVAGPTHNFNVGDVPDLRLRPDLRADAEPRWERVASDGRYAWPDQRIRWMGPDPTPPQLDTDRAQHVRDWEIPVVVDGAPVVITGELHWVPTPSPALPAALGLFVAAAVIAGRSRVVAAVVVALGAAVTATVVVGGTGVMDEASGSQVAALPAAAVALLLALRATARGVAPGARAKALGLAALGLGVAVAFNLGVLSTAVLPGWLPSSVARPLIGAAAGAAVAGAVTSVLSVRGAQGRTGTDATPAADGVRPDLPSDVRSPGG